MSVETEFDLGSLTWVKGELDNALEAARTALATWNGTDSNPLKAAAAHLHQVYGALQIVDLQGVSHVANETERLIAEMALQESLRTPAARDIALQAIAALKAYLDELMAGAAQVELKLAATLHAVVTCRGGDAPSPSELFYPDTSVRVPRESPEVPLDNEARNRVVRSARLRYQKGLLQFLQNKDAQHGLMEMHAAIGEVEKVAAGAAQYTFWWTTAALMEALQRQGVSADFLLKRLCGRIDMQMRRLMDGSRQLADRLVRDILFYVAQDAAPSGRTAKVQQLFGLANYFPVVERPEEGVARAHLAVLRDNLLAAKEYWVLYCAGQAENLPPFQQAIVAVAEAAAHLPNSDMQALANGVNTITQRLSAEAGALQNDALQNEALQLEMATALLLAQNATEHYRELDEEFQVQASTQAMRLQAAIDPTFDISMLPDVPMLDQISRQAQEKLVLAQVAQEVQANLNRIEEILDLFFRDVSDRAGLPMLPNLLKQVLGALNVLQLDVAAALVNEAIQRIEHFSEEEAHIAPENLNWVAEALSTLGLYLAALQHGRDDKQGMLNLLAQAEVIVLPEMSVEEQIMLDIDRLKETVNKWRAKSDEGSDIAARAALKAQLNQLARDADLIGDAGLRKQADAAMKALDSSQAEAGASPALIQAVKSIGAAGTAVEALPPSADAERLLAASDEDVDQEMLGVFIEEAHDVLADVFQHVAGLTLSPADKAAFTAIRRGFHTLKGSGRMVGLHDLAEPAWEIEQTLNLWLRTEKFPNAAMFDFLQWAGDVFQGWVSTLEKQGRGGVDFSGGLPEAVELVAKARELREGAVVESSAVESTPEPEPPRPKAEADVVAESSQDVGETQVTEIVVGEHHLPAELFAIYRDEALQRLAELAVAQQGMALAGHTAAWSDFIRAAHTLAGISRTTGFTPLATAAHAVECWAEQWPDKAAALPNAVQQSLQGALAQLQQAVQGILAGAFPAEMPEVALALAGEADGAAAEVEVAAGAGAAKSLAADDLDATLLPIFLEEAAELLPRIGSALRQWRATPTASRDALKRDLHTLKGSARMAGAMRLGEAVHALETQVIDWGDQPATAPFLDLLEAAYDHLSDLVEQIGAPSVSSASSASDLTPAADLTVAPDSSAALLPQGAQAPMRQEDELHTRQTLRLKADIMDTLLNEAGEVAIARSRIENVLSSYKLTVEELASNVERLRAQLRELEIQAESQMHSRLSQVDASQFDPLEFDRFSRLQELTRLMAESVNDVATAQDNLLTGINETDNALLVQARMTRNLQQALMHIRMVPLSSLAERLHRVVRQAAKETGRKAQLLLDGGHTEMDRSILDKIAAPLEHLVRNAVAHGIETPAQRLAVGKTDYGELRLSARQEGNEIIIVLTDDGGGIDWAAVRAQAAAVGWLPPAAPLEPEKLEPFLFRSGFSTAGEVTETAGRGVGLDVVKNDIAGIGGRVKLESKAGEGVRFTIRLPLTLALTQVVLARAGGQIWALPAALITLVQEISVEQIAAQLDASAVLGALTLEGESYPLRTLSDLVGRKAYATESRYCALLWLHAGERRLVIRVDALEGNHEAVIKNLGPQLARIAGVSGATVLGDGRVALIIDPFLLAERAAPQRAGHAQEVMPLAPLIMVVDDSLTVRKITTRFLQREGYRVVVARDGVEALDMLAAHDHESSTHELPALMLLDIEMPRMDGFEVVRHMRASEALRHLPIIMITSRTADKHRSLAMEAGVNAFMGKPYQEEALLAEIQRLMKNL